MDQLQTRLEALEQRTHTVARQLRWWRGLAGALVVLGLLTWTLPAGTAQEAQKKKKDLEERVAALENLLKHFSRDSNEVIIKGANLHIVNGLGQTDCTDEEFNPIPDCPNGLGNLIVGYNEPLVFEVGEDPNVRTGSHNVVVGREHNFSRFGGLVVGLQNDISGDFASVSGGVGNRASGFNASVCGGQFNTASGGVSSVSGGQFNMASGSFFASVSGGVFNTASGFRASVSGGENNTASGDVSSVSGGRNRTALGEFDWVAGSLFEDE